MDKERLIKEAKGIVDNSKQELRGKATQLENLRELVRRGNTPLEEIILYIEYQKARKQLPENFAKNLVEHLRRSGNEFKKDPHALKYFIGNLVRAGIIYAKEG